MMPWWVGFSLIVALIGGIVGWEVYLKFFREVPEGAAIESVEP